MSKIVVYSSNMCGTCEMVKSYLLLKKVNFIEKNISIDIDGRSELLEKGFDTTPVTMIGDIWISGFDTHEIDEALANTGQM